MPHRTNTDGSTVTEDRYIRLHQNTDGSLFTMVVTKGDGVPQLVPNPEHCPKLEDLLSKERHALEAGQPINQTDRLHMVNAASDLMAAYRFIGGENRDVQRLVLMLQTENSQLRAKVDAPGAGSDLLTANTKPVPVVVERIAEEPKDDIRKAQSEGTPGWTWAVVVLLMGLALLVMSLREDAPVQELPVPPMDNPSFTPDSTP